MFYLKVVNCVLSYQDCFSCLTLPLFQLRNTSRLQPLLLQCGCKRGLADKVPDPRPPRMSSRFQDKAYMVIGDNYVYVGGGGEVLGASVIAPSDV